ncbi:hypothetical protein DL96DRAFT_1483595, partial [Flagelloscypha sp. PMI_526]
RAKAVGLSTAWCWAWNFGLAYFVPPSLANIAWKTYMIFGCFNWTAFLHVFLCFVPETVGRSLEEMDEVFAVGHTFSAWKIGKDVGKKSVADVLEKSKAFEQPKASEEKGDSLKQTESA